MNSQQCAISHGLKKMYLRSTIKWPASHLNQRYFLSLSRLPFFFQWLPQDALMKMHRINYLHYYYWFIPRGSFSYGNRFGIILLSKLDKTVWPIDVDFMWKMGYNGHKPYALVKDGLLEMSNGSRKNFSSTVKVHLLMINASCHFFFCFTLWKMSLVPTHFQADKQQTIQSSGAHAAEVLEGLSIRYTKLLCTSYPLLSKRIFAPIIFPPKNAAPSKRTRKKILIFTRKKNWGHFRETELNSMTSICTVCVCMRGWWSLRTGLLDWQQL